jgi:hypothetical protein
MGYQQDGPFFEDSLSLKLTPTHATRNFFVGLSDLQWFDHPASVALNALVGVTVQVEKGRRPGVTPVSESAWALPAVNSIPMI